MKEKEEAEENKCNNFYILESIGRARIVQQFRIGGLGGVGSDRRITVDTLSVLITS